MIIKYKYTNLAQSNKHFNLGLIRNISVTTTENSCL